MFHYKVRKSHSDFDQLSNSHLNIGHVCECWSISRIFSKPTFFVVHNNQGLSTVHTKVGSFFVKTLSVTFFGRNVMLKCWYGHKFPNCALKKCWCPSILKISWAYVRKSILWLEAPSLSIWDWPQCKELRWENLGFGIVCTKDPNKGDCFKLHNMVADKKTDHIMRSTQFLLCRPNFFPPPYYGV